MQEWTDRTNHMLDTGSGKFRLWIRRHIDELDRAIAGLQAALIAKAEVHAAAVMPGFSNRRSASGFTASASSFRRPSRPR